MRAQYSNRGTRNGRALFIQDVKTRTNAAVLMLLHQNCLRNCVGDLLSLALNKDMYDRVLNICLVSRKLKLGYKIYRIKIEVQNI